MDRRFYYGERYEVGLLIEQVEPCDYYQDGIRYRFLLMDSIKEKTRYLVDNYHDHPPHEHKVYHLEREKRSPLDVKNQADARRHFFDEVERIIENEK